MDGYSFTDQVRHALQAAREEAAGLGHYYVGTEHIFLGLLRSRSSLAAAVLTNLGFSSQAIREDVLATLLPGSSQRKGGVDLPYTGRAKKVLELAMAEAHQLKHTYVGTEHLLLGLALEAGGIAA